MILHLPRWVVICKELTKIHMGLTFSKQTVKTFVNFRCFQFSYARKKNVNLYSAYCHIKLISWCCCNYFVQCTEIQSMSENQTTSAEVVLYRIPNMFSASNHMVYTACMLKGPFPFFQKNHFSSKFI